MDVAQVIFYLLAFLVLASALMAALVKNLVRAIFMFFVTLFAVAGLYVFALADFVAVTQVIVYVGGVLVLMLFAFMLTSKKVLNNLQQAEGSFISVNKIPAALIAVLFFIVLVNVITKADTAHLSWIIQASQNGDIINPNDTTVDNLGINLMTHYLLPFEAVSVLLLMVLVGAAHLARKEEHKLP